MRRVTLAGAAIIGALLLAIPSAFAKTDLAAADPGITATDDHDRRHVPADRTGLELCADPGRDEGVLQLHQRPARSRQEARDRWSADRLEVLRRRLQPGQLGAAAAEARRAGQGLRRRRHARHRGQPGGAALPELAEGAARPRLDRRQRVRQGRQGQYPWTIGWQPDYIAEARLYGLDIKKNHPNAKIAILYQNDSYGKDYLYGFKSALGKALADKLIVGEQAYDVLGGATPASQLARLRASGADTLMIFVTPTPTIQSYAIMRALNWKPAQHLRRTRSRRPTRSWAPRSGTRAPRR